MEAIYENRIATVSIEAACTYYVRKTELVEEVYDSALYKKIKKI